MWQVALPLSPPAPTHASRDGAECIYEQIKQCAVGIIFCFYQAEKKEKRAWVWVFIKMTHLFSNFSKVIQLKVLTANFNYSLHWSEYRIHHVELVHLTKLFSFSLPIRQREVGVEERKQSTNGIVMRCRYLLITKTIIITTALIFFIVNLMFIVRKLPGQSHYSSSILALPC